MKFLSSLLNRKIANGRRIRDFAFDPLDGEDYPAIRCVILDDGKAYSWHGPERPLQEPCQLSKHWALLKRDLLDGMVLDLRGRRGTRANDLVLRPDGEIWRLAAVDTGPLALLRRLSGGRLGGNGSEANRLDWKYVDFLRGGHSRRWLSGQDRTSSTGRYCCPHRLYFLLARGRIAALAG